MIWQYEYTAYVWPTLVTAGISASLALYGWRRRSVPAAIPFAVMMLFTVPWELGAAMETAAVGADARVFWFKFQSVWPLPAVSAALWFSLAYADLRRWLVQRRLILLAIPPLLGALLVVKNEAHHWVWVGYSLDGKVRPLRGVLSPFWVG